MKDKIVIANASGFWGDEGAAIARQIRGGKIDYLTMDYLAEITMIIMARQRAASEEAGYARDFVAYLAPLLKEIAAAGITVVTNAGGMNPGACGRALERAIEEQGLDLPVAVVDGDDILPRLADLQGGGCKFAHLDHGKPLGDLASKVNSANAYLGARPIVAALERGARIVVTGRTYDAASVVAPMVYEFGWSWDDYDKLASALLAGHLIECGPQSTGGNFTDWTDVPDFGDMGYPLVEVSPDSSFVLTKHDGTGGLVDCRTAREQTLYEIGNPGAYACPDVVADFTSFRMEEDGPNRVKVTGTTGRAPTDQLKVSMTYDAGFKSAAMVIVSGPDVLAKAHKLAEIFWSRVGTDFEDHRTDLIGYSGCWGEAAAESGPEPNEVLLRFAARSEDKRPLIRFARELAGIALAGPPGICGAGGRPKPSPAFGYWPALVERKHLTARTFVGGESIENPCDQGESLPYPEPVAEAPEPAGAAGPRRRVALMEVAHARSGDKGDLANIGVAARRPEFYPEILRELTAERVAEYFRSNTRGKVTRYRLDNIDSLNFVLSAALGGGGTISLLVDAQGKTLSQGLLRMEIEVAESLLALQEQDQEQRG